MFAIEDLIAIIMLRLYWVEDELYMVEGEISYLAHRMKFTYNNHYNTHRAGK